MPTNRPTSSPADPADQPAPADQAAPWRVPVIGGLPADQRLLGGVRELAASVVTALLDRVPIYRRLPREQLTGELTRDAERRIRALAHAVRTGLPAPAEEFTAVREAAARRAEEGLPLDAVLLAHHLGLEVCWEFLTRDAHAGDAADLLLLNRLLLDQLRRATIAAGTGFLDGQRSAGDRRSTARQSLLTALLAGTPAAEAAARAGTELPAGYAVLCLSLADHPDEHSPGVDPGIAARRKLRRFGAELDHRTRQSALTSLTPSGGLVLLPLDTPPDRSADPSVGEAAAEPWPQLAAALAAAARAAGVPVLAGACAATPAEVPGAAALAYEVLDVARAFGLPPGLHRLDDVLLEYQLTRPSRARSRLAALLEPLADGGELLTTLRTHLAGGLNRRHTASALHLHPNTVDYRLRRIAVLTGLDPARPADVLRITAAIAARTAEQSAPARQPAERPSPAAQL
ncbi:MULTISPECIES: PucR family transcriptional regulator [Kitasatospora]|uniref:Helix-turn-helix domain-containing protein n=1 Tax=Kitasatospora cathayae TaxID=3004092 RepID=A0ABY7PZ74_9ACTN|nr:helix-turn-helix domain-containing protein [Kitasatospora sp. HUAS 3-15]WBP85720.1 helix-turn-helix domain-containing protein [Kitasatospora sp. HUAS 3-15]